MVAPGFIDVHTHYDAQLTWDPATPSLYHGVTTVLGGNCGFSLAPLDEKSAAYVIPMLARVEGMPPEALDHGLDVTWSTFAEYLERLEGTIAVNAGFMVGHSAIRRLVMGEAAVGEQATLDQIASMVDVLHQSLDAGGLGFSTSRGQAHMDHLGDPVPSRHASLTEILSLCRATGQHEGTSLEAIPTLDQEFDELNQMLLLSMTVVAQRPINWNTLTLEQDDVARRSRLAASDTSQAAGGRVVALSPCEATVTRFCLESPALWESIPGWADTMHLPLAARIEAFKRTEVRQLLREGASKSLAGG